MLNTKCLSVALRTIWSPRKVGRQINFTAGKLFFNHYLGLFPTCQWVSLAN